MILWTLPRREKTSRNEKKIARARAARDPRMSHFRRLRAVVLLQRNYFTQQ